LYDIDDDDDDDDDDDVVVVIRLLRLVVKVLLPLDVEGSMVLQE